jgi:hypothetical protein
MICERKCSDDEQKRILNYLMHENGDDGICREEGLEMTI